MSARERLHAAVCDALRAALAPVAVFDGAAMRAAVPHAVVEDPLLADWSTKDMTGREGRIAVTLHDQGERPLRLRALAGAAEAALEAIDGELGEGWRIVALTLVRSRIVRSAGGWIATSEFRVRMLRTN